MPEEKRDEYQVIAYRFDLVTITAAEYRELIIASIESKALAERRLTDWCNLLEKVKSLEEEIALWKEKAGAADAAYFALLESSRAYTGSEHVNPEAVNVDA